MGPQSISSRNNSLLAATGNMDVVAKDIAAAVDNNQCALALMLHERVKKVINTSGAYYHIGQKGVPESLSGELPRLSKVYWSHSDIYKQMRDMKKTTNGKGAGPITKQRAKKGGGRFQGLITGTQVHKEMRDFTVLDSKNFTKQYGRSLHPYCARLLNVILERMDLLPFLPEFDIYDESLHIGTSIDMVCLDKAGKLVLLEFKTGYKDYFDGEDGFMAGVLSGMRNTPQNQATLQLTCSAQILHRKYDVPLQQMRLYIMRVDDETLDIIPVDDQFVDEVGEHVYQGLLQYQQKKVAERAANGRNKKKGRPTSCRK